MKETWIEWAWEIITYKPDATMWDLLKVMYTVTGKKDHNGELVEFRKFPVNETDEEVDRIYQMHLDGDSPKTISNALGIKKDYVVAYLEGAGFKRWQFDLPSWPRNIYSTYKYQINY